MVRYFVEKTRPMVLSDVFSPGQAVVMGLVGASQVVQW